MAKKKMRGVPKLGERIKRFMAAANLNASELSARTGISGAYLSRILNGAVVNPGIDFVKRIAAGLGVTETQLVRDEDVQEIRLVEVEDGEAEEEDQAITMRMPTLADPSLALTDSLLLITFEQIAIRIKSAHLSEEVLKKVAAGLLDATKLLLKQHE